MATLATIAVAVIALITSVVSLWFGRKKSEAETENIAVQSALNLAKAQGEELGELRAVAKELRSDVQNLLRRERIRNRLEMEHEMWDRQAVNTLRMHGIEIEEPPSLNVDDAPDPHGVRTRAEDMGLPGTR